MTRLLLVRHGETVDNLNKIMQGQTDGCLTLNGIEQARQLGNELLNEKIDVFISSDLKRAIQTLEEIMRPRGMNGGYTLLPLLRERDWGSFTGRYIPDLKDELWPEDIETLDEMKNRAQQFIDYVCHNYPGQTILAVGHGIINKAIQSVYSGRPMNEIQKMMNCEVRVLEL